MPELRTAAKLEADRKPRIKLPRVAAEATAAKRLAVADAVGREIDARLTRLRAELEVLSDNADRLARLAKPGPG